tara:strand:+ start:1989 stop:2408 length:420 start_codon:yes stop_codon:yes gene_type:complete
MNSRNGSSRSGSDFFVGLIILAFLIFVLWYFLLRPSQIEIDPLFAGEENQETPVEDTLENALRKLELTPSADRAPTVTPLTTLNELNNQTYVIKQGDVLSEVAARFNVSVNQLVKFNKIEDPDKISVGLKLLIPDGNED